MAPAAARTRPAWPALTSVHALAFHPDGRRHLRCLHRDHGYPRRDGYLVRRGHHLVHRHQSLDVIQVLRLRLLGAVRSRQDGLLGLDGLRRQDRPDHRDVRREHSDVRQWLRLRGHQDVALGARQDVAPGRGCCRPDADVPRPHEAGTGCCRPDADADAAYRRAKRQAFRSRRCPRWKPRRRPGAPGVRVAWSGRTGSPCLHSSRVRRTSSRRAPTRCVPTRCVPMGRWPRVRVLLLRVQRPLWALGDEARPAWARSLPWVSQAPERVPWRPGRPHGPCERRGLPVSRKVL